MNGCGSSPIVLTTLAASAGARCAGSRSKPAAGRGATACSEGLFLRHPVVAPCKSPLPSQTAWPDCSRPFPTVPALPGILRFVRGRSGHSVANRGNPWGGPRRARPWCDLIPAGPSTAQLAGADQFLSRVGGQGPSGVPSWDEDVASGASWCGREVSGRPCREGPRDAPRCSGP